MKTSKQKNGKATKTTKAKGVDESRQKWENYKQSAYNRDALAMYAAMRHALDALNEFIGKYPSAEAALKSLVREGCEPRDDTHPEKLIDLVGFAAKALELVIVDIDAYPLIPGSSFAR